MKSLSWFPIFLTIVSVATLMLSSPVPSLSVTSGERNVDAEVQHGVGPEANEIVEPSQRSDTLSISSGKDSFVCDSFGMYGHEDKNFGGDPKMFLAWESTSGDETFFPFRGLIHFDVSDLPTDIEIVSAAMKLYYEESWDLNGREAGIDVPVTISAHPLTHSWVEGTSTWEGGGQPNGVTWNTFDGNNPWSSPGGDYEQQRKVDAITPQAYGWVEWEIKDFVQDWSDGEMENHGIILIVHSRPQQDFLKFLTTFNGQGNTPKLEIEYRELNKPPTAFIDTIHPNPAKEYTNVTFTGHGEDPEDDPEDLAGFLWTAKSDYLPLIVLGRSRTLTLDNLSAGTYSIRFRVQDSRGVWSPFVEARDPLLITPDEPPEKISDLAAVPHGAESDSVNLTWTAVAEDGTDRDGSASRYLVKYSKGHISDEIDFNAAKDLPNPEDVPSPGEPGSEEILTVTDLAQTEEYYFAVVAVDGRGQRSELSNIARIIVPDRDSPSGITDLRAAPGVGDGEVDLSWSSPADGDVPVAEYIIKYSEKDFRYPWDFDQADPIPNAGDIPRPSFPDRPEEVTIKGLEGRMTYYFSIVSLDDWGNRGPMSNVASAIATDGTPPEKITGLSAEDTPDDNGKRITLSWDATDEKYFEEYRIYASQMVITDVGTLEPIMILDERDVTTVKISDSSDFHVVDRTDYYFAVVALDDYGNFDPEVDSFGPVISVNNLRKPQPFDNPERGTTYNHNILQPNTMVVCEVTRIDVVRQRTQKNNDMFEERVSYHMEGTVSVPGDEISHIDIYRWGTNEEGDREWMPLVDRAKAEGLNKNFPNYAEQYYETFIHPQITGDLWSLKYETEGTGEMEDLETIGEGGADEKIYLVAWTVTSEWNNIVVEYTPGIEWEWIDSDADGLPDIWEEENFRSIAKHDGKDDPDADGFSNLKEYEEGTGPVSKLSHPSGEGDVTESGAKAAGSGGDGSGEDIFPPWLVWAVLIIIVVAVVAIVLIMVFKRRRGGGEGMGGTKGKYVSPEISGGTEEQVRVIQPGDQSTEEAAELSEQPASLSQAQTQDQRAPEPQALSAPQQPARQLPQAGGWSSGETDERTLSAGAAEPSAVKEKQMLALPAGPAEPAKPSLAGVADRDLGAGEVPEEEGGAKKGKVRRVRKAKVKRRVIRTTDDGKTADGREEEEGKEKDLNSAGPSGEKKISGEPEADIEEAKRGEEGEGSGIDNASDTEGVGGGKEEEKQKNEGNALATSSEENEEEFDDMLDDLMSDL